MINVKKIIPCDNDKEMFEIMQQKKKTLLLLNNMTIKLSMCRVAKPD